MTASPPTATRLRVSHLSARQPNPFALRPDGEARQAIATELDLSSLPKLAFEGEIRATSGEGWLLNGRLRATVVQPCVVSLRPVRTALDETVTRRYSPHLAAPEADETEMPDETLEPLGNFIDLGAVMIEELSLALPPWPRAEGAELPEGAQDDPDGGEPGGDASEDGTRRPFAGLDKLLGQEPREG